MIEGMESENMMDRNMGIIECTIHLEEAPHRAEDIVESICRNVNVSSLQETREYRRQYHRDYKKRWHNEMNEIDKENRRINHNQKDR